MQRVNDPPPPTLCPRPAPACTFCERGEHESCSERTSGCGCAARAHGTRHPAARSRLTDEEINAEIEAVRRKRPGHRDYVVEPKHVVVIDYTNWKGERRTRRIVPIPNTLTFRETPHHKPAQWVFDALDLEREDHARRTFALRSVHSWSAP